MNRTTLTLLSGEGGRVANVRPKSGNPFAMNLEDPDLQAAFDLLIAAAEAQDTSLIKQKQDEIDSRSELILQTIPFVEQSATDAELLDIAEIFPEWHDLIGEHVNTGRVLRYGGNLYRVRQEHDVLEHYPPSIDTAALYLMIVPPDEEGQILPWEDRHGMGKELYKTGDVVTHAGFFWTSRVDNNHWEPTETNWAAWTKGDPI